MSFSKQSNQQIDNFVKTLKSKQKQIDEFQSLIKEHYDSMNQIKQDLDLILKDEKATVNEKSKKFIDRLKDLEIIGEKYDKTVKHLKEISDKIDLELTILVSNIQQLEPSKKDGDYIRNEVLKYITK